MTILISGCELKEISVLPMESIRYFSWYEMMRSFIGLLVRSLISRPIESMNSWVKKLPHSRVLVSSSAQLS